MKIKKFKMIFLFISFILIGCDDMSGPTKRIEVTSNPIEVIEGEEKPIEVKFRDTYNQFRNNKKDINYENLKKILFNDDTFKEFKGTNMDIKKYEEWFLENAFMKGIDKKDLKLVLEKIDLLLNNEILKYPIIIDTLVFKDKECFVIAYTWEYKENINDEIKYKKVSILDNKMLIVIEKKKGEILAMVKDM